MGSGGRRSKIIQLKPLTDPKHLQGMKTVLQRIILEQEQEIVRRRKIIIQYERYITKIDNEGIYEQQMEVFG